MAQGRNARVIWQDLVDDHGFASGYASVQRFVKRLRATRRPETHPVITTAPGDTNCARGNRGAPSRIS